MRCRSRRRRTALEAREEVAAGLARLLQPHGGEVAEDVAAIGAADAGPEGPGAAARADTKDQTGQGGVAPLAGRQSSDGERRELLRRHIRGPRFWAQFGRTRLTIHGNTAQS